MATNTPINARDLGLQSTIDRLLGVNTNYVSLSSPTLQFKYGTDNAAQPSQAIVTATLVGSLQGIVTFATTGITPAPTSTTNTLTILPDNITGDVATINASLNYLGNNYQAVPITITKIFNQLVAKLDRQVDLIASYNDGTGYTLPGTNTISLVNGVVALTSGVTYGPASQTSNGLTATVNTSTGVVTLTAPVAWTGNSASFTFTATRNLISYNVSYVITKAKQGQGGQQLAEVALYQWATAQPLAPTGTSTYTWVGQGHSYNGVDTWTTTVPSNPGTAGIKLWKIVKTVAAESISTATTASLTWGAPTTIRVITTEANELIKTYTATVYKNDISLPTIAGTSTFTWSSYNISAAPSGWSLTAPDTQQGFTLFQATVDLIAAQSETSSTIAWTNAIITPVRYYGADAVSPVTVALTNPYHVFPASDAVGTVVNYFNSGTDLIAYEGATPLVYDGIGTSKGSYKVTQTGSFVTPGAITKVIDAITFARVGVSTATNFPTSGGGTATYFVSGVRWTGQAFTYTVQQTFAKALDSAARYMLSTATVITKNLAGQYNPTTVTFTYYSYTTPNVFGGSGYYKIFENNDQVAKYSTGTAENFKVYTPSATASKIRVYLYSDAAFTTLLDQTVVYISKDGESGQTSAIGRTAYAVVTTTPAALPTSLTVTGDNPPTANTWFASTTWLDKPPIAALSESQSLYQSDGVYVIGGDTTWGAPYLSTLKVGNLSALTANTGKLKVTGDILGGNATAYNAGSGYVLTSDGKLRLGGATGTRLEWDGSALAIYSDTKTILSAGEIKWDTIGGTGRPDNNATRNTFKGTWVTGTTYIIGDIVAYGDNTYSCILASSGTTLPTNTTYWSPYAASGSSVKLQYSTDNSNWHDTYVAGDLYIRSGTRDVGATTYTFGTGTKFVPVLGTDYYQPATFDITNSGAVFNKNAAGTTSPDSITLTTAFANIVSPSYQWYKNGAAIGSATASSYAVPKADYASVTTNAYKCIVTGTISGVASSTREDTITIPLLKDGSSAIQVLNSNENITFTADTTGFSNISFANGSSTITAYIGTTQLDYAASGANTFSATLAATSATVAGGVGNGKLLIVDAPTAMSAETAYTTVTVTVRDAANVATTITTVIGYSLSRKGIKGEDSTVPGGPGPRGSVHAYISGRTSWSDATANDYFTTNFGGVKVITDLVTQYGTNFSQTKSWTGSWTTVDQVIDGNLLVTGTVSADKLAANSILVGHQIKNASGTFIIDFGTNPYISISV